MAVITNPITLPANWFEASVTQLIVQSRLVQSVQTQDWEKALLNRFTQGKVPFGGGVNFTFTKDLNPKIARPKNPNSVPGTSGAGISPFDYVNKKSFLQAAVLVDTPKLTYVTYDMFDTVNQSFENSSGVSQYMALILASNQLTIDADFTDICLALWNGATTGQTTQEIVIKLYDLEVITDPFDRENAERFNSKAINKLIDYITGDITTLNTDYTNTNANYTKGENVYAIFNKKYTREIATGTIGMYNKEVINYTIPDLQTIILPDRVVADKDVICTLQTDKRFCFLAGYRMGLSNVNQVTAEVTVFDHYQYGVGELQDALFIRIKADHSLTFGADEASSPETYVDGIINASQGA